MTSRSKGTAEHHTVPSAAEASRISLEGRALVLSLGLSVSLEFCSHRSRGSWILNEVLEHGFNDISPSQTAHVKDSRGITAPCGESPMESWAELNRKVNAA